LDTNQALKILEVDANVTIDDIKTAYRKLALELHPDKNIKTKDDKQFKKATEAYQILKLEYSKPESVRKIKQTYTNAKTKTEHTFYNERPKRESPRARKTPEEDWGRFTKDIEDENPNFFKEYEKKFWQDYDKYLKKDAKNGEYDKAKEPNGQPDLNVEVDPSLCIACCSCETIAPDVFVIDKQSRMNPKSQVINPRGAKLNKIMNAAETCPTKAIKVENKITKERLFPW